jgi:AcrR family transcriptional regulator
MNQLVHSGAASLAEAAPAKEGRTNDPARTMAVILQVATHEFADKGLAGARIDEIAAATRTSKRMIYYYFGSKDGLYLAVLEEAYRRMRSIEADLHLDDLPPVQALRSLVEFTYDHHRDNEDFIRLVMSENIHRAEYLRQSKTIEQLNGQAIDTVRALYERGVAQGVFRPGLDPVDLWHDLPARAHRRQGRNLAARACGAADLALCGSCRRGIAASCLCTEPSRVTTYLQKTNQSVHLRSGKRGETSCSTNSSMATASC